MKAVVNSERCKACGLCMVYCPKHAIWMTENLNKNGYRTVSVRKDDCVGCGICYTVCPDGVFSILDQEEYQ